MKAEPLPVVVLVGDSIRMGYSAVVADRLRGQAQVVSATESGESSRKVLHYLDDWVIRHRPTVVHLNAGLHDIMTDLSTGLRKVEPEEYRANLRAIFDRLSRETSARLIFATTTPVLESRRVRPPDFLLHNADVQAYNLLASRIVAGTSLVTLDDLYSCTTRIGPERALSNDGVHFTQLGSQALGEQVAGSVASALLGPPVVRRVVCCRAIYRPRVDGRVVDDPAWANAVVVDAFPQFWSGQTAIDRTDARLLWDDDGLYFGVSMDDDHLESVGTRRNDRIWLGDAFGLILQPDENRPDHFEYQINPRSVSMELALPGPTTDFATLERQPPLGMVAVASPELGRRGEARGWAAEGRIPWSAFDQAGGRPAPGSVWRITMFRTNSDRRGSRPRLTSSSTLRRPDVHRLNESGWLLFEP